MFRATFVLTLSLTVMAALGPAAAGELRTLLPMPASPDYVGECGGCHTAYAPTFLPAVSWRTLMANLDRHFGDDASLSADVSDTLRNQIETLAGDTPFGVAAITRRNARPPAGEAALRITASPFFAYLHDEIPGSIWKRTKIGGKSNCIACHPKANQGSYFESEIRIPK